MKKQLEIVVLIVWVIFLCIVFVNNVPAGEVKLEWDPIPGAIKYKLYYGEEIHLHHTVIDVGPSTRFTFPNVDTNKQCCFAISYIDFDWKESRFVEEICGCRKIYDKKDHSKD